MCLSLIKKSNMWASFSSIGKVFCGRIRDMSFDPCLHKKSNWYFGSIIKNNHQEPTS